jgi:hypothetical protein
MSLFGIGFRSSPSMTCSTVLYSVFTKPVNFPTYAGYRSYKPGSTVDRFSVLSWNLSERTGVLFRCCTTELTRSVKYFGSELRAIRDQTGYDAMRWAERFTSFRTNVVTTEECGNSEGNTCQGKTQAVRHVTDMCTV